MSHCDCDHCRMAHGLPRAANGGSAFPQIATGDGNQYTEGYVYTIHNGMSLRDWFAGQALMAICRQMTQLSMPEEIAARSYNYADAMLAARSKP